MLEREQVVQIVEEVLEKRLGDYLSRYMADREKEYEKIGLLERLIRLEEEIRAQRELMEAKFEAVDRRFEAIDRRFEDINVRFEDVNKRFEDVNRRFEDMARRFTMLTWLISSLFAALALLITVFKFVG